MDASNLTRLRKKLLPRRGRIGFDSARRLCRHGGSRGAAPPVVDHRQTEKLCRGQAGDYARRRAPSAQGRQQPGREFPPTDATARAHHEAVQVSRQVQRFHSIYDQVANLFPAAPTKTPPQSFIPPAIKRSTLGPRSPARRRRQNHACQQPSLKPSWCRHCVGGS